ncbi:hypothetical protein LUZ63_015077 [Rhynchospora breviuscula]|uniref:Uncharacterized protein n=1 Tax=Rhynchospora breviuscula TaxID=2022672 RepID=A0A9Q0CBV5_9POAL|nr:hypothetical protein LUZ63_015077 [Rhynchospora breviuscula]
MGNCIKISAPTATTSSDHDQVPEVIIRPEEEKSLETREGGGNGNGVKVKVLLTRAELEWLMAQLKNGEKKLEEVLAEMGREREREKGRCDGWKPSLESIVEIPELLCFD